MKSTSPSWATWKNKVCSDDPGSTVTPRRWRVQAVWAMEWAKPLAQARLTPAEQVQSKQTACLSQGGPSETEQKQLDEVHIAIVGDVEE